MRARDDRGSRIRVRAPWVTGLPTKAQKRDARLLELRLLFVRMFRKGSVQVAVVELVGLWLAAGLFLIPGVIGFLEERHGVFMLLMMVGGLLGVFGAMRPGMLVREYAQRRRDFRDTLRADPYCVACGYHLEGVSAEGDGCIVCPECGAAWRLGGNERGG